MSPFHGNKILSPLHSPRAHRYFGAVKNLTILSTLSLMLSAGCLQAQTDHFPNMKWKEKELDHFVIRTFRTNADPARRFAEKTYKILLEVMPGLKTDFEGKEFRTPAGEDASRGKQFRFTTYLVETGDSYNKLVTAATKEFGWSAGDVTLVKKVGNFMDSQNRYLVICKGDPMDSGGGNVQDKEKLLVHQIGSSFVSGQARANRLPFWMTAGMGYYAEHKIFKRCSIYYIDFEEYYKNNPDAQIDAQKGGTLSNDKPWPRIVRKLCKKGSRCSLQQVLNAKIITLSPNQTGYIFALTSFMVSTEERQKKFQSYLAAIREGEKPESELLLKSFGYSSEAAFEKDWYEWILGKNFK